jgi:hypothetical protein
VRIRRRQADIRDGPTRSRLAPCGIAIDGKYAYVTTNSVLAGEGKVLRIRL